MHIHFRSFNDLPVEENTKDVVEDDVKVNFDCDRDQNLQRVPVSAANEKEATAAYDATDWIAAIIAEQKYPKQHNIYQVIERSAVPTMKRFFYPKMVLKRKLLPPTVELPLGFIEKHKCRLTVAAYTKMLKQGIDYEEKHYASTVRWIRTKRI